MSTSLYRWNESCDGDYCRGDCDLCEKEEVIDIDNEEELRELQVGCKMLHGDQVL